MEFTLIKSYLIAITFSLLVFLQASTFIMQKDKPLILIKENVQEVTQEEEITQVIKNSTYVRHLETLKAWNLNSSLALKTSNILEWDMKIDDKQFTMSVTVNTPKGERIIHYISKSTGKGKNGIHSYIGLGADITDGEWHKFTRNIEIDIQRYEPNIHLTSIKHINHGNNENFGDFKLYSSKGSSNKKISIDTPIIVSAPGIVLTFDDSHIKEWYDSKDIFKTNGVVVTWFCHGWSSSSRPITATEVSKLKDLADDGHEIAYHGKDHLSTNGISAQNYFSQQITPGIDDMKNKGFSPSSFAYPMISGTPKHNKLIRTALPHVREFFAHVLFIDRSNEAGKYGGNIENIKKLMDKLKKEKDIGVLSGHLILPRGQGAYKHTTDKEKILAIIKYAKQIGLRFYTLNEAHKIYLNGLK